MAKSISVNKKARGPGRPKKRGGVHPVSAVRLPPEISAGVDAWAAKQADAPGRSEAIRRLVEMGLSQTREAGPRVLSTAKEAAARVAELAAKAIGNRSRVPSKKR
jgi:hypothetical protein